MPLLNKRMLLILLLFFSTLFLHAQDTSWTIVKADHVFSVSMPRNFIKTDTSFRTAEGTISYTILQLWNGAVLLRITKGESLYKMKDGKAFYLSRIESSIQDIGRNSGFTPIFLDTVISNVKGLEGLLYKEDDVVNRCYCFFVEGKIYSIFYTTLTPGTKEHYDDFKRMLATMHFSSQEATDTSETVMTIVPEQPKNDFSGRLIVCIILAVMIVGGVFYLKRRN